MTFPNFETLAMTITPPFAQVTLNRPEVKNAMNGQMVLDLIAAFERLQDNREVRAIVLSGAGGTFCAGGDIKELAAVMQGGMDEQAGLLDKLLRLVNQAPQVVIAKIEGAAMGGGFGLVCVADIAIASTDVKMGMPEVRLGLVPALISPYVIQRIGLTRARELMLTGRRFGGEEAQQYGIVHETCPSDVLDERVNAILDHIRQCSPQALAACKQLIFTVMDQSLDATVDYRAKLLTDLRHSDEGTEGMMAFAQKRPPKWADK
ncbi:MAG: enoyl-CoA hydratase-related protein [Chloroflexota bacterium]